MNEKRTLKTFIKSNRGKIVRGTLIVLGIVVSVVIYKTIRANDLGKEGLDVLENLGDDLSDGAEVLGEITKI